MTRVSEERLDQVLLIMLGFVLGVFASNAVWVSLVGL